MKVSLNWLRDYVDLPKDIAPSTLMHDLTMTTVEVEGIEVLADQFDKVVVAKIASLKPVPNSKKLNHAECDIGQDQTVSVACGASNCSQGQWVVLALPGASVKHRSSGERFTIEKTTLAGVESNGMICSADELGLGLLFPPAQEKAIIDLSAEDELELSVGTPLVDALNLNDIILDIDNKSLTNRPDLWGHYGLARELAAIYELPFKRIERVQQDMLAKPLVGEVNETICNRFTAHTINHVSNGPAPFWLRARLAMTEHKPISMWVDLTNYVMLDVGQPSHAYDATQVQLPFGVRYATADESLTLLDESELSLNDRHALITDSHDKPLALAGVMGGHSSALNDSTSDIVLEMANFDPLVVRRTANSAGVRSDASARFEKGVDTQRIDVALSRLIALVSELQPKAKWQWGADHIHALTPSINIVLSLTFLSKRLGQSVSAEDVETLLTRIGFKVSPGDVSDELMIEVPSWRATGDVSEPSDLVEEIARFKGYEQFEPTAPSVTLEKRSMARQQRTLRLVKECLAKECGLQEVQTYPWVGTDALEAMNIPTNDRLAIPEGPSGESTVLQPSVLPNLLAFAVDNFRYYQNFGLFTASAVFSGALNQQGQETQADEHTELGCVWAGQDPEALFFNAKGVLEELCKRVHVPAVTVHAETSVPWGDPAARAELRIDHQAVGHCALVAARTKRLIGLKPTHHVVAMQLDTSVWQANAFTTRHNNYQPVHDWPTVELDLNLVYPKTTQWQAICEVVNDAHDWVLNTEWVSTYQGEDIPSDEKSVTLRVVLGAQDHTLNNSEINEIKDQLINQLEDKFQASLRV